MASPVMTPIAHAALHSPRYCVLPGAAPAGAPELAGARLRQQAHGGAGNTRAGPSLARRAQEQSTDQQRQTAVIHHMFQCRRQGL